MTAGKLSLAIPGGATHQVVVPVTGDTGKDFDRFAANAIKAFAHSQGVSPLAVDYTIRYN